MESIFQDVLSLLGDLPLVFAETSTAAPTEAVEGVSTAGPLAVPPVTIEEASDAPELDFSIAGIFLRADLVVQTVIVLLVAASFWSWTIIFGKTLLLRRVARQSTKFEDSFWSGGSLEDLYDKVSGRQTDPMSSMFGAAMREWQRTPAADVRRSGAIRESLRHRIERVMQVAFGREMDRLERHMTFLASVGSVSPFVGLFGTVWGIMNSFQAIALSRNTNLTAVAPGIAEALFATALGLAAAIPAVIFYNRLSNHLDRYGSRLDAFAGEFNAILSRQLQDAAE